MANDAVVQVESSPTEILSKLTPAEHKTWRATGNLPEEKAAKESVSTEVAGSSPAAKTEVTDPPAKVGETPADSVPAKKEPDPPKANAETRIKDLLAEVKSLRSQIEASSRAAAAAPAKSEEPRKPRRDDTDEKTGLLTHADERGIFSEDKFQDALVEYGIERGSYKTRQDLAKQAQERLQAEIQQLVTTELQTELEAVEKRHTDFREVLQAKTDKDGKALFDNPEIKKIVTNGALDVRIAESPYGWEMLYYLCKNPGVVEKIQSQRTAKSFGKEFRELERAVEATLGTSPKDIKPPETPGSPAPKVSGAPAPAASVSGKATAPVDEENAALAAEDFKRFQREANQREWAAKKGK
jgi:hypothetical protein